MPANKTLLIVCTGNVCRSPMAVGLLRDKLIREKMNQHVRVHSGGIWALEGQLASAYARQVMAEQDLDISEHRGRNLTQVMVDEADLILVMTRHHDQTIARNFEGDADKVHLLSEMTGPAYDIEDPYGGSLTDYRRTATELEDLIERGYSRILKLLGD